MTLIVALAALHAPAYASTAAASETATATIGASDTIRTFYARLTGIMKQGDQLGFAGRYKKLDPVVRQAFNLPLIARLSVGPVWGSATPAEQDEITKAFSSFSVSNYASRFTHYAGEDFEVTGEQQVSGGKLVETTLTPKGGVSVTLNYLMRQDEAGDWRIVDVYLAGAISELATRRAEFSAVIQRDGIGALVNSLDAKSKRMGPS